MRCCAQRMATRRAGMRSEQKPKKNIVERKCRKVDSSGSIAAPFCAYKNDDERNKKCMYVEAKAPR